MDQDAELFDLDIDLVNSTNTEGGYVSRSIRLERVKLQVAISWYIYIREYVREDKGIYNKYTIIMVKY